MNARGTQVWRSFTLAPLLACLAVLAFLTTPALAAVGAPTIEGESVSNVTEHDATLEAQIDPEGLETAYEFQIDTNGSYDYTKSACPLGECEAISVGEPLVGSSGGDLAAVWVC
jgi:hypothetical protein